MVEGPGECVQSCPVENTHLIVFIRSNFKDLQDFMLKIGHSKYIAA